MFSNMKAELIFDDRIKIADQTFAEIVLWKVPVPVRGSSHTFKYRLAFIVEDVCVVRFDNEAGKGDHMHIGDQEEPYVFTNIQTLLADFQNAVVGWRG
jgi:hypothetical protein